MSALPRRCAVLIVGAGPTGLTLSIRLRQLGVDCLLIDRLAAPQPWSRALGLHARSLEILDALGVLDSVRARSATVGGLQIHNHKGLLFEANLDRLDAPFPWVLSCPQPAFEAVLEEHLQTCGGRIERGVTLTSFRQDGNAVTAQVQTAAGEQTVSCQVMVGCDGADSLVRDTLGLSFEGAEYPDAFLLADLDIDWDLPADRAHAFLLPEGIMLAQPMPRGWRLMLDQPGELLESVGEPDLEPVRERLASALGVCPPLSTPWALHRFAVHRRLVGRYRVNRVLLAGDACHVQSPLGAQGMNTGIADAFNLAWKAALFVDGQGGGLLLDSYETERRPVARTMLTSVDLLSRTFLARSTVVRGARDSMLRLAGHRPRFGARLMRRASQLNVNYRDSSLVAAGPALFTALGKEGPEPGDRVPDARLQRALDGEPARIQALLREPHHHLLIQLSEALEHSEIVAAFALADRVPAEFAPWLRTHLIMADHWPDPLQEMREFPVNLLVDAEAEFRRRFGDRAALWLLRPDGHLGYRAPLSDGDHLLHYLRRLLHRR